MLVCFAGALALGFSLHRFEKLGWALVILMLASAVTALFVPMVMGVKTFDIFALTLVCGFGMSLAERRAKAKKAKADFEALKTARPKYLHCPHCRSPLAERVIDDKKRLACTHCQFIHWNNPLPVAAAVIPHVSGGIVLVKRGVEPRKGMWCLPAGFMEIGETPEQGAAREAGEEANVKIEIEGLIHTFAAPAQVLLFFAARPIDQTPTPGSDALEARVFPLNELPSDIAFSSHVDAINIWRQRAGL